MTRDEVGTKGRQVSIAVEAARGAVVLDSHDRSTITYPFTVFSQSLDHRLVSDSASFNQLQPFIHAGRSFPDFIANLTRSASLCRKTD